jgi:phospholipid transport system substrate-binding protein
VLAVPRAAIASEVSDPIEQLNAGLLQTMRAGKATPFQQRYDLLAPLVNRAFDLEFILQGAVGARWASLSADQLAALKAAFQRYSIATYVSNFDAFSGERFELLPGSKTVGGNPLVQVKIVPGSPGEEVHVLGYMMRQTSGGWKAVDVTADGSISQVATQQAEIHSLLTRGDVTGLLARLQQKTAELSGSALR